MSLTQPFAWILLALYDFTGNYGWAIVLFSLAFKLIFMPLQMKGKRGMMNMSRLSSKVKELEKKHEGNQKAYQEEVSKLYKSEKVNPMSGCLWNLIPFPILIALYSVIRQPLSQLMRLTSGQVSKITNYFVIKGLYEIPAKADAYAEIPLANLMHEHFEAIRTIVPESIDIDLNFLGLNLGDRPQWNFFLRVDWSDLSDWLPALGLFLIPIISALIGYLTMEISNKMNPQVQSGTEQQKKTMKYTALMMPLVSLYICFIMPAALGVYWIAQGFFGLFQEIILTKHYTKKLAAEQEVRERDEKLREIEYEKKRTETEKLRAEGKTTKNSNTSKKRLTAQERAKEDERHAATERAEREERRKKLGIEAPDISDAQSGNRKFARGRAYVADRFFDSETSTDESGPDDSDGESEGYPEIETRKDDPDGEDKINEQEEFRPPDEAEDRQQRFL